MYRYSGITARSITNFRQVKLLRLTTKDPGVLVLFDSLLLAFAKLRKSTVSFIMSVRPRGTNLFPLDGFFVKFCVGTFVKIVEKIKVSFKWGKMSGALHKDLI